MSDNYRFYAAQVLKHRMAERALTPELHDDLKQLLFVVSQCEAMWALEDRIERGLGPGHRTEPTPESQP
jgi:hypothetical protein